jgi:hypothetical protein
LSRVGDILVHLSSTTNMGLEEIVHLLNLISTRTFTSVPLLDEVALEATELSQDLQNEKGNFDISKTLRGLDFTELGPGPQPAEIPIPHFGRSLRIPKGVSLASGLLRSFVVDSTPEAIAMLGIEELRVRVEQAEQMVVAATSAVNDDCTDMRHLITEKIDSPSFDRVVKKLEGMLVKVQKDVSKIRVEETTPARPVGRNQSEASDLKVTTARSVAEQTPRPASAPALVQSVPQRTLPLWPQPANPVALKALKVQADHARDERRISRKAKKSLVIPDPKK